MGSENPSPGVLRTLRDGVLRTLRQGVLRTLRQGVLRTFAGGSQNPSPGGSQNALASCQTQVSDPLGDVLRPTPGSEKEGALGGVPLGLC